MLYLLYLLSLKCANNIPEGAPGFFMNSRTQDMRYRQSLTKYAEKYSVSHMHAGRKYNKVRSALEFQRTRRPKSNRMYRFVYWRRKYHDFPKGFDLREQPLPPFRSLKDGSAVTRTQYLILFHPQVFFKSNEPPWMLSGKIFKFFAFMHD